MKFLNILFIVLIFIVLLFMSKEDLLYLFYFFGIIFIFSVPVITIKIVLDMFKKY